MAPLFEAHDLTLGYGDDVIVEGASLQLTPGSVTVLLGGNGAGKTTLLKACAGLSKLRAGRINLHGDPMHQLSTGVRARRLAYLPQTHRPSFPFPVEEVVLMGRWPHSSPVKGYGATDYAAAHQALEKVGMAELAKRPYTRVSGGERQLVLIARALAQEANVLMLDEPETGLDVGHRQRLMELLKRLAGTGQAVLLSSHFPINTLRFADQVIMLSDRQIIAAGPPKEIMTPERLFDLYGVDVPLPSSLHGRTD